MSNFAQPQGENRTAFDFSHRTDRLAQHLGVALRHIPAKIGISTRMFWAYRKGENRVTAKVQTKLIALEIALGIAQYHGQAEIVKALLDEATPIAEWGAERFHPPAAGTYARARIKGVPTAQDSVDYLAECLAEAKHIPGGVEWVFVQLTEAISLEKLKKRREQEK